MARPRVFDALIGIPQLVSINFVLHIWFAGDVNPQNTLQAARRSLDVGVLRLLFRAIVVDVKVYVIVVRKSQNSTEFDTFISSGILIPHLLIF